MKKSIFTILSITILILAWQLLTMLVRLPELVPSIPHLFSTLVALFASGSFYQSVMATVLRGTIGMSISEFLSCSTNASGFMNYFVRYWPSCVPFRSFHLYSWL